ncbi:SlyX family protein [Aestuariibacter sp. A3R04]|uniref:SlyX family protein n=1 Tax=Aestuariibacter sp. A3R04 TaxID=2841571 RepID=UPI001C08BBF8|nr:SlyX family protein [Aestuariibacter sp. A3R04]MBU3020330.1 SlyX family protein [Aestuariibacter sp. A3R04]
MTIDEAVMAIEELQTKVAFQEHTIDSLNEALTEQQYQIEKLQVQLRHVMEKVKGFEPSNIAKLSEEMPPPHY